MSHAKALAAAVAALFALNSAAADERPGFVKGDILRTAYDGVSDDLLTAGLGKDGLAGAAPGFADPAKPSAAELRRLAIYNNYRALLDMTPGGGYGLLYGPNLDIEGNDTLGQGLIPGVEFIAYAGDASGKANVTLLVQVPDSFDPAAPCMVAGPSSGSRTAYGAISTTGEWGLKHGCAVAYTDKGTGIGVHDLENDSVNLITGVREDAGVAGADSNFTFAARGNPADLAGFTAETPNRFAVKHAHSRQNPERDWGRNVLQSIEFAFFVLNREYPEAEITPDNTIVIASSVSNGGGASIRAAEQDDRGLIDGLAVSEPNVNPAPAATPFAIVQGGGAPITNHSRSLYDYTTLLNVYQGCANLAPANALAPFNFTPFPLGAARCASLHDKGLLSGTTLEAQAAEAQAIINDFAINPEQNPVQPSHWWVFVSPAVALTYANAYGRADVTDNLCGYSFGATAGDILFPDLSQGLPTALPDAATQALFGTANGIPPTGGVNIINNLADGGPREDRVSVSASTGRQDQNLDGALCLRGLATGTDPLTGQPLSGKAAGMAERIAEGIGEVLASGDLNGKPALVVTGRSDAILPINHASRAYFGLNRVVEGAAGGLRYYEVVNAHHLDAFNAFPGFNERFVPLHHYLVQALDLMFDHLKNGAPLPASQVIRPTPRGPGAPAIGPANLPAISPAPDADSLITFAGGQVRIPE
jgi:hydroxybutyrate-dimer hydrolase